jgi:uncharacterized membrane protein
LGAAATRFVDAGRIRALFGVTVLSGSVAIALKQVAESAGLEFLSTAASIILLGVSGAIVVLIGLLLVQAKRQASAPQRVES